MRRKDREMSVEFAVSVADTCEYAVLSMIDPSGEPYGVPLSIALDKNTPNGTVVYFHSAAEGFKTDCLRKNRRVCVSCVGNTRRVEEEYTTKYESAIIRGTASEVTDDEEKIHALRLICARHAPSNMENFDSTVKKSMARTAIWRIEISEITGKANLL